MQFFYTTDALKQKFKNEGLIYFTPAGRRGFYSRVAQRVYGGRVFIELVKSPGNIRWYSVKLVEWSPKYGYTIETVGDLMTTTNPNRAKRAAKALGDLCTAGEVPIYLAYGMSKELAKRVGFTNEME